MNKSDNQRDRRRGRAGERAAVEFLTGLGYSILAVNWRPKDTTVRNEIDVIARVGDTIVFVEVKSAMTEKFGPPETWVGTQKMVKLTRAARAFLAEQTEDKHLSYRFDVIAVSMKDPDNPECRHIQSAFTVEDWAP